MSVNTPTTDHTALIARSRELVQRSREQEAQVKADKASMRETRAELQDAMGALESEVSDAKGLVPRTELPDRFCQLVDAHVERFAGVCPDGETGRFAHQMFRALGDWRQNPRDANLSITTISEVVDFLLFLLGDAIKANASRLETIQGWKDGLPTADRAEKIPELEDGHTELQSAEEAVGDALGDPPSDAVRRRREDEDRAHQLDDMAAAASTQQKDEAKINEHYGRRSTPSPYITANAPARQADVK